LIHARLQEEPPVVIGEPLLGEPGDDARPVRNLECRREFSALCAGPQLPQLEAIAQQQAQGVEQDRFAGAGFPGQHGETAVELEVERLDDDEVADRQEPEHAKASVGPGRALP
jgi:hypothetical protein